MNDANVACKQLGFGAADKIYNKSYFGSNNSAFSISNVECNGYESALLDCAHRTENSCGAGGAAGVVCHAPGQFISTIPRKYQVYLPYNFNILKLHKYYD